MSTTFGDRIRDARKAAGLTQRQLADKIDVSNTSISNWENSFSMPDPDTIQHLCWALGVQPNYFFTFGETVRIPSPTFSPAYSTRKIPSQNIIRIAGRDGSFQERHLTDEQMAALKAILDQMPDVPDDL